MIIIQKDGAMFKALKSKLMIQLAIIITIFIFLVELVLLIISVQHQANKYHSLRDALRVDIQKYSSESFKNDFPATLSEADITQRIDLYTRNIIVLILIIIVTVVMGTLLVFYKFAGAPILQLIELNKKSSKAGNAIRFPENEIPKNEIGDLIIERNRMLMRFENFENELEEKINEMKTTVIQSTKMSLVGEFTSGIVHDINNPLSIIIMHGDRLKKNAKGLLEENAKAQQSMEKIMLAAERIQEMTSRLGKMGRRELEFQKDLVLNEVIENSLTFLGYKLKPRAIKINNQLENKITCYGDHNSLEQVFSNLFSNACDAMENSETKELTISQLESSNPKEILIKVSDTGAGIDRENLEKIFDRFFTTKSRGKGTGLGLSTSMRILKDHGGAMDVESILGKGTSFIITLNKEF